MATASLLDIVNAPRTVPIQGKDIPVRGVSFEVLAGLLVRFPEIGKAFSGMSINKNALLEMAPAAVAAIIAAGTGHADDDKHEIAASQLGIGDQADLIDEVLRLTFPRGIGPFVQRLEGMGVLARGLEGVAAQVQPSQQTPKSSSPPDIKEQ